MKKNQELIRFRTLVRSVLPGHFLSRGVDPAGLEFQGLREYEPGESTENIDWNASGMTYPREILMRMGERRRNLLVVLVIDASRSMATKREFIVGLWQALSLEALDFGLELALVAVGKEAELLIRPNIGGARAEKVLQGIRVFPFAEERTDLAKVFEFLTKRFRNLSQVAVVVSDLLFEADYGKALARFRKVGNEVVFLVTHDECEKNIAFPLWAAASARDSETGELGYISSSADVTGRLASHVSLCGQYGCGWALIDELGMRQEILEEKLKQAFSYPKKRKETR